MRTTDIPAKIPKAFAVNGDKNTIPESSSTAQENTGSASLDRGFPPLTMLARSAGGVPPDGKDMNGILFAISDVSKWSSAGMSFPFDASFAASIGGYPKGAIVSNSLNDGYWLNTIEQNMANPEASGAVLTGWVPYAPRGVTTITGLSGTSRTLSTLEASRPRIVLSGSLTSNVNIILPSWVMEWDIVNLCTGNFQVIARTNVGDGVVLFQGGSTVIFCYGQGATKDRGDVALYDVLPVIKGGTGATSAESARSNLGLGSVSTENIVPVTKGGTGATSAVDALSNLGGFPSSGGFIMGSTTVIGALTAQNSDILIADKDGVRIFEISAKADNSVTFTALKPGKGFSIDNNGNLTTYIGCQLLESGQRVYSPNNPPPIARTAVIGVRLSGRIVQSDTGGRIDLPSGCVYTGMSGANYNTTIWAAYSAIQVNINGTWATVATV